jgi:phospholipid/cholesterol/gamma-HCH transport system substrate-binding protein
MKNEASKKIRLGIFVTLGILFFIIGIYYIGQQQRLFSPTIRIVSVFKDINGLQVGNNVRYAGINVGTVDNIVLTSDTSVEVSVLIDKDLREFVKKDATATIGSEGLMGNKIVVIASGSMASAAIENDDYIKSVAPINMDDIMANLKVTTDNAAVITEDIAVITGYMSRGDGPIGKLLIDSNLAETVDQTLNNLKSATKGLDDNMEAAKHNFLLKGYFKKKEREAEKQKKDSLGGR